MAVSGSKDFEPDVADYVEEAFERCGLEFRTGYDAVTARRSLNFLFADWANRGLNRWTMDQVSQPVVSGLAEYPVGTITATVGASTNLVLGNTITGQTSAATAVVLTKPSSTTITTSIPNGSFTAGETISSTDSGGSATTTTIAADLSVEDVRATIDILSAVIRRSNTDISIARVSRDTFLNIPNKTTTGRPTQYYVDRQITPVLKIWPTPENSTDIFIYDRLVRIDDADNSVNTVEVPFRFYPCLAAGLAYYIALKRSPDRVQLLKGLYEEEFIRAADEDRDKVSINLVPSYTFVSAVS
tara:strand:- start:46 stop:945 length:900 start_codon:yes stop_codon:yes gene_type:complete